MRQLEKIFAFLNLAREQTLFHILTFLEKQETLTENNDNHSMIYTATS